MAFSAADVGIKTRSAGLIAVRSYLYLLLEQGERAAQFRYEHHLLAGICHLDAWDRAIFTQ